MNIRCRFLTNFNICRKFWSQFQKSSQLLLIQWCQFSNNFVFRNLDICQKTMSTIHVVWACCVCVFSRNLQMTYGLFKGHWQKIISGRVVFLVVTDRFSTRVEKERNAEKKALENNYSVMSHAIAFSIRKETWERGVVIYLPTFHLL